MPALMFGSWVLNEIWIIDLCSTFIQIISFEFRCETVIRIVLCYSHEICCLPYKVTNFAKLATVPLNFCRMWLRFRI